MSSKEKKAESSMAVAVISSTTPTYDIIAKLDNEIKKLKHIEETPWKTSGKVDGFSNNIKDEKLIPNLIRMGSAIKAKEKAYSDFAENELGLSAYPAFTVDGGTSADFTADIKLRIDIINQKEKMDKMKEFKEKMSKFLTEAEQKEALVKDMENFFAKM